MKPGDAVQILPTSWIHADGWVEAGKPSTGVITRIAKNGRISVRVNEVRNTVYSGNATTKNETRVLAFPSTDVIPL
jgi:hypothetical protein